MLCHQCVNFFEVKVGSYTDPARDDLKLIFRCQEWPGLFSELYPVLEADRLDKEKYPHIVKCTHFAVKSKTH